jgi:hypothetical protein
LASHCSGAAVDQTGALIASRSILRLVARESKHGQYAIAKIVPHESEDIAAGWGPP